MIQLYFLSAWLPANDQPREYYAKKLGDDLYNVGVVLPVGAIEPGGNKKITVPLYAGPQEQDHLSKVAPGLDLVVDYGVLTVISAPLFWVLAWLNKLVHNWGVAIILLTVLIKLAFYPLVRKKLPLHGANARARAEAAKTQGAVRRRPPAFASRP